MINDRMIRECYTPNEEVIRMCRAHYEKGRADERFYSYRSGYLRGKFFAIEDCLEIIESYRNSSDGIFMAIQELNELKEICNDQLDENTN